MDLRAKLQGAYDNSENSSEGDYKKYGADNFEKEDNNKVEVPKQSSPKKEERKTNPVREEPKVEVTEREEITPSRINKELSLELVQEIISAYELLDRIELTDNILNAIGANENSTAAEIVLGYIESGISLFTKIDKVIELHYLEPVEMAYSLMAINEDELREIDSNVAAITGKGVNVDVHTNKIEYCKQLQTNIFNITDEQIEQMKELSGADNV